MKQIEFKVNNKNLYRERVILDTGLPVFFVCIDDDLTRYAVLCIDPIDLKYVIHPTTIEHLLGVLRSEITLREFFASAEQYWLVKAGSSYDDDIITELCEFPRDALPVDSFLDYSDTEIEAYIKTLSTPFQFIVKKKIRVINVTTTCRKESERDYSSMFVRNWSSVSNKRYSWGQQVVCLS